MGAVGGDAVKPSALAIPRCFLDPRQVGMAGEAPRLTRRVDLPVWGLGVIGKGLADWLLAEMRCLEAAQVVTILSLSLQHVSPGARTLFGIEILENLPRASDTDATSTATRATLYFYSEPPIPIK